MVMEPSDEDVIDFALQHFTRGALQNKLKNILLERVLVMDEYSELMNDYKPILTKIYLQEHKNIQTRLP